MTIKELKAMINGLSDEMKQSGQFFVLTVDETQYWNRDTLTKWGITHAYGNYLICKDEHIYCCSITPSSYYRSLENSFDFISDEVREKFNTDDDSLRFEAMDHGYFSLIKYNPEKHSRLVKIECDEDENLWDIAQEYFSANF